MRINGHILQCKCGERWKIDASLLSRFLRSSTCRKCGHHGWPSIVPMTDLSNWEWKNVCDGLEEHPDAIANDPEPLIDPLGYKRSS